MAKFCETHVTAQDRGYVDTWLRAYDVAFDQGMADIPSALAGLHAMFATVRTQAGREAHDAAVRMVRQHADALAADAHRPDASPHTRDTAEEVAYLATVMA